MIRHLGMYIRNDFPQDFELEAVSLEELVQERELEIEEESHHQDFYLTPGEPLKFE